MRGLASQGNYGDFLEVIMPKFNVFDAPQRKRKEKP